MTSKQAREIADAMAARIKDLNETLEEMRERAVQLAKDEKKLRARINEASMAHDRFVVTQEALGVL